jgi:hypothetical protein
VKRTAFICILLVMTAGGCASGPPELPYPAFIQVDELSDVFVASLPGVRAKQLAGDPKTRRSSKRIDLPADWSGTSGGAPGRSLEIFVLQGGLKLADLELGPGGYAFLPSGSLGFNLSSPSGARILYFVNDVDPEAVIRSPIILDTDLLDWEASGTIGRFVKELRNDPGNGAMTWLLRIETDAATAWESSSAVREGYLVTGTYQHSECVSGIVHTAQYLPGGYYVRPAGIVNGGPLSKAITESIWLLRRAAGGDTTTVPDCVAQPAAPLP